MAPSTVNVAEYLFTRLYQLGVRDLHGLPGDFNLLACDYVGSSGLTWIGNCNELNAGYAADAYGRLRGLGAIMTTFGVGELSCINAIAGSFSEYVPVVHIVGVPKTVVQKKNAMLHHTLGNGDFDVFARIAKELSIAQANLMDPVTAPDEIDRVLRACYIHSRPVYIQLPADIVQKPVDAKLLDSPIDIETPKSDDEKEGVVADRILKKLYAAKKPILLVDAGAGRHCVEELVDSFARKTLLPTFIAPMGKGMVNEDLPNFVGMYNGALTPIDAWRDMVESSDLIMTIGNVKSDLNTAGFSYNFNKLNTIDLHFDNVSMDYAIYEEIYMRWLLERLVREFDSSKMRKEQTDLPVISRPPVAENANFSKEEITHEYLWPRLSSWLKTGDVVVADTGTSYVGIWETKLPPGVHVMTQILWSSIGYGVPACQGAAQAIKAEGSGRRTICFEGDGSFQLTVQELSTIIHHNLDAIIFVIENDGYEIERWVHGEKASYNDIPKWQYSLFPNAFTPTEKTSERRVKAYKIRTREELEVLLTDKEFSSGKGLHFVEMHMPRHNAPTSLINFTETLKK
ncbi:indole-3-pyruvate decarboxylase [Penicillium chermesinum]|uniref:Pyruvate decarboxylase n=1 Tax=Penicillium chermesinum TaxID=63820 RepID=A0A9W9TYM2_9EURO|nr:indole-3-pyruvate decarboxylase [Penicillium chermesinum]KAJ5249288.1 indole-3-pyruvate decarboxylase [Penicillium chermesinum]KAJ6151376.1 indole-3-pyruvate decarboxylase [Penicillium chermesinum]